jgi:hypothetical protein
MRKSIILGLLAVVALGSALVLLLQAPASSPRSVSVFFRGMTNIPADNLLGDGTPEFPVYDLPAMGVTHVLQSRRIALFTITNESSETIQFNVDRAEVLENGRWVERAPVWGAFGSAMLKAGMSSVRPICEPSTNLPWRVHLTIIEPSRGLKKSLDKATTKMANTVIFPRVDRFVGPSIVNGQAINTGPTNTTWLQASNAAGSELIRDPHVQRGVILLSAQPGKRVPYGTLAGPEKGKPIWDLCQWSSKYPFKEEPPERLSEAVLKYATPGKSIAIGKPGADGFSMAVNGDVEYGGKARKQDEPWVHLLLQQEIEKSPAVADMKSARFHFEARLKSSKKIETPDYSPGLHASQFQVFFSVQNLNRTSAGYGKYLWFGVPVYDDRHRFPAAHKTQDTGGTGMFIFTPSGDVFTSQSAHDKEWIIIDKDILPLLREGLETAWNQGFLKESQTLADYRIGGMNLGWEVPGLFDVDLQFRNLSLRVEPSQP